MNQEDYEQSDLDCVTDGTVLFYTRLSLNATAPFRASKNAAGYDLYSAERVEIPPMGCGRVKTDLTFEFPLGSYGRIDSR